MFHFSQQQRRKKSRCVSSRLGLKRERGHRNVHIFSHAHLDLSDLCCRKEDTGFVEQSSQLEDPTLVSI